MDKNKIEEIKKLSEIGINFFNSKDYSQSLEVFFQIIEIDDKHFQSIYNIGLINLIQGNDDSASEYLERAFYLNKSETYFKSLMHSLSNKSEFDKMDDLIKENEELFQKEYMDSLKEKNAQSKLTIAIAEIISLNKIRDNTSRMKIFNNSEKLIRNFIKTYPNNHNGWSGLAFCLEKKALEKKAEDEILISSETNKDNTVHFEDAIDESIFSYKKAIDLGTKDLAVITNLIQLMISKEKYEETLVLIESQKNNEPLNHELYIYASSIFEKMGNDQKAINELKEIIELDKNYNNAYINLGEIYFKKRELDLSKKVFTQLIEIDPKEFRAYNGLGACLLEEKEFDKAEKMILKSKEINETQIEEKIIEYVDEAINRNLGLLYMRKGELGKGTTILKDSLGIIRFDNSSDQKYDIIE